MSKQRLSEELDGIVAERRPRGRKGRYRARRVVAVVVLLGGVIAWLVVSPQSYEAEPVEPVAAESETSGDSEAPLATEVLAKLETKGRAPKTGYARTEFYNGWPNVDGCSLRQKIIRREMGETAVMDGCDVVAGEYTEPYTGNYEKFSQKSDFSKKVQIDHIVALSNAWQTGAQYKTADERYAMATDPLNLVAADASANMTKGDGDAATWLPPNKAFRCEYVARQIAVKYKYVLWVTAAEREAMGRILEKCPGQRATGVELAR